MVKSSEPPDGSEDDLPMTIWEHIGELRVRLFRAIVGLVPAVMLAWEFKEDLLAFLMQPYRKAWQSLHMSGTATLHFANPVDPFSAYMQISIVIGIIFASPWLFYQAWAFVSPGLYAKEKRYALPFVFAATIFFVGGALFAHMVLLPFGFETFLDMGGTLPGGNLRVEPTIMINEILSFATQILLASGVVFEVPVVVAFLAVTGVVNWRQLLGFGRWWVVIASIIAAILTPPDIGSQMMMLIPLVVLYYLAVLVAYFIGPKVEKETEAEEASDGGA